MIEAHLFGSFEVSVNGTSMGRLRSRKSYVLLALLMLRSDKEVLRDYVCDILWPDSTREKARVGLRQCLNDIRAALNSQAYRISAPSTRSILFLSAGCSIDVVQFDALITAPSPTSEHIEQLLYLYRAPLLEQYAEDFVFYERDLRCRQLGELLEQESDRISQRGNVALASRWARRALVLNPISEVACRSLMTALATERDVPEAIRVYTEFRQRLWREMRMEPSAETVTVYRSLKSPGVATTSSKLRTVRPVTRLLGREAEMAYVDSLLRDARIVTIVGAAGLGKTRLATELAIKGSYAFIPLAPLTVPELLADHVVREMQIHCSEDREPIEALLEHLRTGQDVLVLDNAEHILEECANLVHRLVMETDDTKVIVTSRVALGIPGEHLMHLNPLSTGQASPAVALFVERANMTSPARIDTDADAVLLTRICTGLQGIPLALELAAARLKSISLAQVADRLDDQMRLLRAVDRTRPDGVRTMESAIRASYDALSVTDRSVFRQLCIFPAAFSIDFAERLVADPDVQETLDHLVECSVLFVVASSSEAVRYGMYEVIRQFGEARLVENHEFEATQERLIEVVVALTQQAAPLIATKQRPIWMKKLELERDTWQRALQVCSDGNTFAELVFSLAGYWSLATQGRETAFWLRQIMARRESIAPHHVARAVAGLGIYYWEQCDAENADQYSLEAISLARDQEDREVLARALNTRGLVLRLMGRYEESYRVATEALDLAIELGNDRFATTFRGNVGRCATLCGRYEEALEHLNTVRDTYVQREMPLEAATITYAMAQSYSSAGNTDRAIELFAESLPVFLVEKADIYLGWALHDFLVMCLTNGDDIASANILGAVRMIERTAQTKIYYSVDGHSEELLKGARARMGEGEWLQILTETQAWSLEQCVEFALAWRAPVKQ